MQASSVQCRTSLSRATELYTKFNEGRVHTAVQLITADMQQNVQGDIPMLGGDKWFQFGLLVLSL